MEKLMHAIRFEKFGTPEVLELKQVPIPTISDNEILIKVKAAGVNPIDAKIREGSSFVAKQLKLPSGLGFDVCGEVAEVGKNISEFSKGDLVFGGVGRYNNPSAYAEYCVAKVSDIINIPKDTDCITAAALPVIGTTAWQALQTHGQVKANERVLIHAAAGGVGHIAVQFAKQADAYVIATASSKHHDFLNSLGVDEIIDYKQQDFTKVVKDIDLVIDLVGGETGVRSLDILKPGGRIITIPTITQEEVLAKAKEKNINAKGMVAEVNPTGLQYLIDMVSNKQLTVKIAATFPLAQAAEAHQMLEQKSTQGKIILLVD